MKRLKPMTVVLIVSAALLVVILIVMAIGGRKTANTGAHGEELDVIQSENELTVLDKPAEPNQSNEVVSSSGADSAGAATTENNQGNDENSTTANGNGGQMSLQDGANEWSEDQTDGLDGQYSEQPTEIQGQADDQNVNSDGQSPIGSDGVEPGHHENELPPIEF